MIQNHPQFKELIKLLKFPLDLDSYLVISSQIKLLLDREMMPLKLKIKNLVTLSNNREFLTEVSKQLLVLPTRHWQSRG